MNALHGKIVAITGASSGIGAAAARRFAEEGATVIVTARTLEKLERLAEPYSGTMFAYRLDVTDESDVRSVFENIVRAHGPIDVLVNNAGFGLFETAERTDLAEFTDMMNVNYFGTVRCTKAVLPGMLARGSGHIVNVASVAGFISTAKSSGYSATKHAVIGFTDALRQELHGSGILVTSVNPGPVDTPFFDRADPQGGYKGSIGKLMVSPEKIAEAVVAAVVRKRPQMFVPAYMGWGAALARLIPAGLFTRLAVRFLNRK
ncbi:SDR family NAD(P)-dependent oxidoreductase [Paenibacillus thermotolerans]|uniref:SDR family NAD(P)-dependent oxidoreductase n=1 Tax=Paenibacillus thermotolerans TaxID=3027807 RepID=UPI002368A1B8|nr:MULTISPECIES: SDR family NAD(P)-dependent oxidoreductase [unclassified Paenibacillus]